MIFTDVSITNMGFWEEKPAPTTRLGKPCPLISSAAVPAIVMVSVMLYKRGRGKLAAALARDLFDRRLNREVAVVI